VESVDLKDLGAFIKDFADAGFDPADLENHIRTLVEFPERDEEVLAAAHEERVQRAHDLALATAPHRPGPADPSEESFARQAPQTRVATRRRTTRRDRVTKQRRARHLVAPRPGTLVFPRAA
jgi:hypothetical protein